MVLTLKTSHLVHVRHQSMPLEKGPDAQSRRKSGGLLQCITSIGDRAWFGWVFTYAFVLLLFFIYRCMALKPLLMMYATEKDGTPGVVIGALGLGFLEDFVCATYFASALWAFDTLKAYISSCLTTGDPAIVRLVSKCATFLVSWTLIVAMMAPFVVDMVLVRLRAMRFTFDLVAMAFHEQDHVKAVAVSNEEISEATLTVTEFVLVATFFAIVRTWAVWTDLSSWNPTFLVLSTEDSHMNKGYKQLHGHEVEPKSNSLSPRSHPKPKNYVRHFFKQSCAAFIPLVLFPIIVVGISCASSPLIAYSALNTTLNELFGHALEPTLSVKEATTTTIETLEYSETTSKESSLDSDTNMDNHNDGEVKSSSNKFKPTPKPIVKKVTLPWVETYIDYKTEEHTLLGDDTLYRRTTGFRGDLAFDVDIDKTNPPNVLVIAVEAFRFHDSHYLVGENDPSNLFKGSNITVTPNFDKWAKRGIALANYWSSWRTSRSVESLMFGQIPYDSGTKSGTTNGQRNVKLAGLPQLFSKKGYETFFTTGCRLDFDGWDSFFSIHGFDTVWGRNEMMRMAEREYGIRHSDWQGTEHRGLDWGVHDDLSFQLLGDLLIKRFKEQADRMTNHQLKRPLFLNHYTISSHVDYKQRPKWYDEAKKPDFSALYDGEKYAENVKNYLEIRFFADMELGKFMDRMADAGILNDTIIVISGDHGQGPEFGNDVPEDRDLSVTRVAGAIIAEGRLGDAAGMVIDDATEQYDILNTLADITGVPDGGFEQDGVGRSLKRKITFGERVVYSNNPTRKMSVVRGHERLRYDKVTDSMLLHNADTDHDMQNNLLPGLTAEQKAEWVKWRDAGRRINSYYTNRWERKCLLGSDC